MKFLIAGFGSIGRRHLRNLRALGEQDILLYRTGHSTLADDELAGLTVETSLAAALAHQPEAVIVANPTALHLEVAIPAAEAGCHLFLEKPISHSLERVADLQQAVTRSAVQVLVGFQFRFHPGLRQVRELLGSGRLGRPLSVRVHWGEYLPNWHPWEDYRLGYAARADLGGGVVLTLCHPIDYLRWLFGEVAELKSFAGHLSDLEVETEDLAEILLRFESGVIGSLHLDYCQQPPAHRMEIVCTGGTIRWDNADGAVQAYSAEAAAWETFPVPEGFDRNDMFLEQTHHFLQVVRGEAAPACSLSDGVRALELALAARGFPMHPSPAGRGAGGEG
jgi:predicted dehydrogenase